MKNSLPLLKDMILPSFFTLIKGVRIKNEGISLEKEFKNVTINASELKNYTQFFDWQEKVPLSFFYLMAQRAQTSLMLHPEFTIAIPGLVHVSNRLEKIKQIDYNAPFDIITKVEVPHKEIGSLIPRYEVQFLQNNHPVVFCESVYIAKRKGNKKSNNQNNEDTLPTEIVFSDIWDIPKNLGRTYGKASGDKNPIHYSTLFAKMAGFKNPILHGWYGVSRLIKEYEKQNNFDCKYIEADFKSPIYLPSSQKVSWSKTQDDEVFFQINDAVHNRIILTLKIR